MAAQLLLSGHSGVGGVGRGGGGGGRGGGGEREGGWFLQDKGRFSDCVFCSSALFGSICAKQSWFSLMVEIIAIITFITAMIVYPRALNQADGRGVNAQHPNDSSGSIALESSIETHCGSGSINPFDSIHSFPIELS